MNRNTQTRLFSTKRLCPVCHCQQAYLLHYIDYPNEYGRILPTRYRIVACLHCGMVYDDFDEGEEVFAKHYAVDGKYEMLESAGAGGDRAEDARRWEEIVKRVSPFFLHDTSTAILDIGCGKGGLLKWLNDLGYKNLVGTDASPGCVDFIKARYGFEAKCGVLTDLGDERKFDFIFCNQVMEHLVNCRACITAIRNLMSNNGFLYLEMPDASRYLAYTKAPFYYFDQEHINHFQPVSLRNLLKENGLLPIQVFQFEAQPVADFFTPNIGVIVSKAESESVDEPQMNDFTSVVAYIDDCCRRDKHIMNSLPGKILGNGVLWGCGAFCKRILKEKRFANCNLLGIIDLDLKKKGKRIEGLTVYGKEYLTQNAQIDYVIITSVLYESQIREMLQQVGFKGLILGAEQV